MTTKDQWKIRKELGEKIKAAREKAGMTQTEVSVASKVDVNYYSRIERGIANPSFEKLHALMKVLGMESLDV